MDPDVVSRLASEGRLSWTVLVLVLVGAGIVQVIAAIVSVLAIRGRVMDSVDERIEDAWKARLPGLLDELDKRISGRLTDSTALTGSAFRLAMGEAFTAHESREDDRLEKALERVAKDAAGRVDSLHKDNARILDTLAEYRQQVGRVATRVARVEGQMDVMRAKMGLAPATGPVRSPEDDSKP